MKKLFYAALLLGLAVACGKTEPIKDSGNNNNENKPDDPARTEWTLTYAVALPKETAKYLDVEISHKDAAGKVVADGTLTSASTNDGWPNDDFRNLLVEAAKQKGWSEDVYTQDLIIKKISVGKVKADYKDIENVLVVTIKLHGDIPENITAATLLPFSTYQTEDRSFIGTTTLFSPSAKSPDLKTFLTTEASSGKKLTDRNWGFDYVGLD